MCNGYKSKGKTVENNSIKIIWVPLANLVNLFKGEFLYS